MEIIYFSIAGFIIKLIFEKSEYHYQRKVFINQIKNHFSGFILSRFCKETDFTIRIIENQILRINNMQNEYYISYYINKTREIVTYYHISLIQFQVVLRTVLQTLLRKSNGLLLHASAASIGGKAYLFLGRSGSGKSTIIKYLKDKYVSLSDDTAIIKKENRRFYFYQTPFTEKEFWVPKNSKRYLIKRIYILRKSQNYKIVMIPRLDIAFRILLDSLLTQRNDLKEQIKTIGKFLNQFNYFYYLYFGLNKSKFVKLLRRSQEKN